MFFTSQTNFETRYSSSCNIDTKGVPLSETKWLSCGKTLTLAIDEVASLASNSLLAMMNLLIEFYLTIQYPDNLTY